MSAGVQSQSVGETVRREAALQFRLADGLYSVPLKSLHRVVGCAALTGEPEGCFAGWLKFHGEQVPVFYLESVMGNMEAPAEFAPRFGTNILLFARDGSNTLVGLLVDDVQELRDESVTPLAVESYLPMLDHLIPEPTA